MRYDPATDAVVGSIASVDADDVAIEIACDGRPWATVHARPTGDSGRLTFTCSLAPVAEPTISIVTVHAIDTSHAGRATFERVPLRNGHGLLASDVFATDHHPFLALPWYSFDGTRVTLGGMHLPPEGDPTKLAVAFGPGVSYDVSYGAHSPDFREHYWYWPNADRSGITIVVDLPACTRDSDPFHFRFVYPDAVAIGGARRPIDVWIPRDLRSFIGFPIDASQITRTQTNATAAAAAVTGYNAFKTLEALFARHGVTKHQHPHVLDWGCGHGRIACHVIDAWPQATLTGADVDAENVAWCASRLRGRFVVAPLWPPSGLEPETFDAAFGVSVMTHLGADAQAAWLAELARVTKPGGIVLLTFQADAHAAYTSRWRDAAWWERWRTNPFDDELRDHPIAGKLADPSYYRSTTQSTRDFIEACSRSFDVVAIEQAIFGGYQDCAVLRRRPS